RVLLAPHREPGRDGRRSEPASLPLGPPERPCQPAERVPHTLTSVSRSPPIYGGDGPAITLGTKDAYVVSRTKLARTLFPLPLLMSSGCGNDRSGSGGSGGGAGGGGNEGQGGGGGGRGRWWGGA